MYEIKYPEYMLYILRQDKVLTQLVKGQNFIRPIAVRQFMLDKILN